MPGDNFSCEQLSLIPVRKVYYSISEVCRLTGLEPHVLRYWESEFSQLRPKKNRAGNRAYREKDIELICYIKHLLYEEKFTIPGAKKKLLEGKSAENTEQPKAEVQQSESENDAAPEPVNTISQVKSELNDILAMLRS